MRSLVLVVVLVLAGVPAAAARADDAPEEPLVKLPDYGLDAIAPEPEERPEGWNPVGEAGVIPRTAPTVQAILDVAARAHIAEPKVAVRAIPLQRGAGPERVAVLVTLVAVDEKAGAFTRALATAAGEHGWVVREMGSPFRVMIVWGSTTEAAHAVRDWLVDRVVRRTMERAVKQILQAGRSGSRELWTVGLRLLERAARIEPRAGFVRAVQGRMVPRERPEEALAHYRLAIRPDAPVPAPDDWKSTAAARLGQLLLERAVAEELSEALAALRLAVDLETHIDTPLERFGARYNLACAYARLGKKDEAFPHLDAALRYGHAHLGQQYAFHHDHAESRDPDMAPLRADERFTQILQRHDPSRPPSPAAPKDG